MFHKFSFLAAFFVITRLVSAQQAMYAQCGGTGWTGGTSCVSGATCVVVNAYYWQCQPSSSTTSKASSTTSKTSSTTTTTSTSKTSSTTTTSKTSTSTTSSSTCPAVPRLKGVNTAGYDFTVATDGSFSGSGSTPPVGQFAHFANQGVNAFRIPFAWQLMTPTLGGTIDSGFFSRYDATVQAALATGAYVILDLHNYARWNGQIIGQSGGPTVAQFTSIWSQLAAKYANNNKIIFGLMNEPHDMPSISSWVSAVQSAVNAIRSAGAKCQLILLPGSTWSSAQTLPTEAGPSLLTVTDPSGGVSRLIFDVHKYLDSDNSGTHSDCVTDNTSVFATLVSWLQSNGNRQALLTETGGGHTTSCYTYLKSQLAYVKGAYPSMLGYTVWSAGAFDVSYILSVTPNSDGSDQALWTNAVVPNL